MHHQVAPVTGLVLLLLAFTVVGASYLKFYNERTENYKKHMYVLNHECNSGRQLPQIQYNRMTYDGTSTNCTEALVFTSILPCMGAIYDMWTSSPFFALMYATDWKIQMIYAVLAIVAVVTTIRSYFAHRSHQAVLSTFSDSKNQARVVKSQVGGRAQMLVKTAPATPMKQLAADLLEDMPTFTSTSSSCA